MWPKRSHVGKKISFRRPALIEFSLSMLDGCHPLSEQNTDQFISGRSLFLSLKNYLSFFWGVSPFSFGHVDVCKMQYTIHLSTEGKIERFSFLRNCGAVSNTVFHVKHENSI